MASSSAASKAAGTVQLPPTTTEAAKPTRSPAVAAKVRHLEQQLDAKFRTEADLRLRQVLDSNPSGKFSDADTAAYRQREADERESFDLLKKAQVNELVNNLMAGEMYNPPLTYPSSFARPPPRGPAVEAGGFRARPFPPPRPNRNIRDLSSEITTTTGYSTAPRQSDTAPTSGTNAGAPQPETKPETGLTREQVVDALFFMQAQLATSQAETASVKTDLDRLNTALREAVEQMENLGIAKRLNGLETRVDQALDARALEAEKALIVNLTGEVASLRSGVQELFAGQDKFVMKQSYQAETELTKMTFNNKCSLIEKYLGIDISTTGPKPHDVLEALHKRVWQLESSLPQNNEGYKGSTQYAPLNEYMKNPITRSNSMVNYSATPGFSGVNPGYVGGAPAAHVGATPGYMGAAGYGGAAVEPRGYTSNASINQMHLTPLPAPMYMHSTPNHGRFIGFAAAPGMMGDYTMSPHHPSVDTFGQRRNAASGMYGPIYPADYSKMAEAQATKAGATASGAPAVDDQIGPAGSTGTQVPANGPTHSLSPAYSGAIGSSKLLGKDWRRSAPNTPQEQLTGKAAKAAVSKETKALPTDRLMRNVSVDPDTYDKPGPSNRSGSSSRAGSPNDSELLDLSMALIPLQKSKIDDIDGGGASTPRAAELNAGSSSGTVQDAIPISGPDVIDCPTIAGASISRPVTALASSSENGGQHTSAYRSWMNQKPGEFVGKKLEKLEKLGQSVSEPQDKDDDEPA